MKTIIGFLNFANLLLCMLISSCGQIQNGSHDSSTC